MLHPVPITNEYYTPKPTQAFFVTYGIATRGFELDLFEMILHHQMLRVVIYRETKSQAQSSCVIQV